VNEPERRRRRRKDDDHIWFTTRKKRIIDVYIKAQNASCWFHPNRIKIRETKQQQQHQFKNRKKMEKKISI
jgi:hypothetical protein